MTFRLGEEREEWYLFGSFDLHLPFFCFEVLVDPVAAASALGWGPVSATPAILVAFQGLAPGLWAPCLSTCWTMEGHTPQPILVNKTWSQCPTSDHFEFEGSPEQAAWASQICLIHQKVSPSNTGKGLNKLELQRLVENRRRYLNLWKTIFLSLSHSSYAKLDSDKLLYKFATSHSFI